MKTEKEELINNIFEVLKKSQGLNDASLKAMAVLFAEVITNKLTKKED
jgi:hypothetical protein